MGKTYAEMKKEFKEKYGMDVEDFFPPLPELETNLTPGSTAQQLWLLRQQQWFKDHGLVYY